MKKLSTSSRVIIAFTSLSIIAAYFFPVWRIDLFAPQYPEGLVMKIWLKNLTGDVDIINGLNHYIGMKKISVEMFPEFSFLIYVVAAFILYGLIISITGSRKILFSYLAVSAIAGLLAIYDFYQWGYDYGHNLNPDAPIKVPGMGYQPPLIGHKKLLNFDAYSMPDVGGYVIVIVVFIAAIVWFFEFKKRKKIIPMRFIGLIIFLVFLTSCTTEPQPLIVGRDECNFCKMPVADTKFGAELITEKGKLYKFDDVGCMIRFLKEGLSASEIVKRTLAVNYNKNRELIDVEKTVFLKSTNLRTPMNSGITAFASHNEAESILKDFPGEILTWQQLYQELE